MDAALPNGTLFKLKYTNYGSVKVYDVAKQLPEREPDHIEFSEVTKDHTGAPMGTVKYWFEEGRVLVTVKYYDDDRDIKSLKITNEPGACAICPLSGHLMHVSGNDSGWAYSDQQSQEAYMNWLCDQTFVGEDETV